MGSKRIWYKRYPSDALAGMVILTAEERGVYNTIIDLTHAYNRPPLYDHFSDLARICGCSTRRLKTIINDLVNKYEKLVIKDGFIVNERALKDMEFGEEEFERLSKNSRKNGEKTEKKQSKIKDKIEKKTTQSNKNNNLDKKGANQAKRLEAKRTPIVPLDVFNLWNEEAKKSGLPKALNLTKDRDKKLRLRINEFGEPILEAVKAIHKSEFCRGGSDRGWKADFDFILQPKSINKALEGAYGNGGSNDFSQY